MATAKQPKAHKFFGIHDGILGYHYDWNGTPPSADPSSDEMLMEMGWGSRPSPSVPDAVMQDPPKSAEAEEGPQPALIAPKEEPQTQGARLTAERLQELQVQKALPPGSLVPGGAAQEKAVLTRRAAYNLLNRVKNNPSRHNLLDPKLREKLLTSDSDTAVPGELVTQLLNAGGDLQALNASFSLTHEKEQYELDSSKLKPKTEEQLLKAYGPDKAKNVMAFKLSQGLYKDDPNLPGGKVYMMLDETRPVLLGKAICGIYVYIYIHIYVQ